jgi:RNA-directed DNA polymerase
LAREHGLNARRIVDRRVLHLIRMWLECPVEETDNRGRKKRTTEARDSRRGIPQGSPISPLLANIYMRRFVLAWKKLGLQRSLGSRIVTYADDLVILCKRGKAEEALSRLREIMSKLKLTVNEEKTRICKVPEGEFDFLGCPQQCGAVVLPCGCCDLEEIEAHCNSPSVRLNAIRGKPVDPELAL